MRRTAAVLPNVSNAGQTGSHQLMKGADADLAISPEWFVVRSRRHVSPDTFQHWVRAVGECLGEELTGEIPPYHSSRLTRRMEGANVKGIAEMLLVIY